jgi:hypothetical protein
MEQTLTDADQILTLLFSQEAVDYSRVSLFTLNDVKQRGMLQPSCISSGQRRYSLARLNEPVRTHRHSAERG